MRSLTAVLAVTLLSAPALAADVGVSIEVGEPGFYGRIELGDAPRPVLLYPDPVIIVRSSRPPPAIYMRVPPGHARNWRKHCGAYDACGRPVYFVQDGWYHDVYSPHYRKTHPRKGGRGHGKDQGRG